MTRTVKPRSARARDPYGIGPIGSSVAPIASVVGLVLIALVTVNLFNYQLPFTGGGSGSNGLILWKGCGLILPSNRCRALAQR